MRPFILAASLISATTLTAFAQSSSVGDSTPFENVRGGSLAGRNPGGQVVEALGRHRDLQNERFGGGSLDATFDSGSSPGGITTGAAAPGSTGTSTSSGGIDGLIDSVLDSTGLGGLTGVAGALGGLLDTGTTTTTPAAPSSSGGLADLIRDQVEAGGGSSRTVTQPGPVQPGLQQPVVDPTGLLKGADGREQSVIGGNVAQSGGAFARLPKPDATQQAIDDEPSFRVRLLDAWLGALFTGLTFGFTSADFINLLETSFEPLFSTGGDAGDGGGGTGSTDGIEGVDPTTPPTDSGGI